MKPPDGKWWNATFNPVTGCTPVSAGCQNCWAKAMHARWAKGKPFSEITLHHDRLEQPLHWKNPRKVAVCLMGDLFHDDVPDEFVNEVFRMMYRAGRHFYFILTKRAERMADYARWFESTVCTMYNNVALGTSVEDQATADERIPHLLKCPAAMRFVSVEPMLGAVDLTHIPYRHPAGGLHRMDTLAGYGGWGDCDRSKYKLDWVIVGSESGPGARPMDLDWVRSIRDQCVEAGTPLWFKQRIVNGKRYNMPELDGVVYDQMPEVTVPSCPENSHHGSSA